MNISESAYKQLLREYDEKQLKAVQACRYRTRRIEGEIPELNMINSRIAQLSVDMAVMRIRGRGADRQAYDREMKSLTARKEALLRNAGYTPEDLKPRYECSLCGDTGFIDGKECSCFKNAIISLLYDQSNLRQILEKENFGTFSFRYYSREPLEGKPSESPFLIAQKAVSTAKDFVLSFEESSDNLFITGETGTGKTFLCNCIAKEILDQGHPVIYLSAVKLFGILADNTFGSRNQERIAEDLFSCDLLIIDDLGTEYTNAFIQSAFFNCINERLLRNRHTIISTNLSIEQIRNSYSERVFSRIAEKYTFIKLFGKDIRIMKKLEG
ncbi:MAG: ATP-binding protein [Parasporobacterium sp.]|nr:ATP-binding protein [Parasporobacterium sp.]